MMRTMTALFRTTMTSLLATVLLLGSFVPLQAQEATTPPPAAPPSAGVKVLRVDPADVNAVGTLLSGLGVDVRLSQKLGLITVSGPEEALARVEEAVRNIEIERVKRRTDESAQTVQLTVYFLGIVEDESSAMPAGPLRDVVAELKKTFPFGGYKLLETVVLRTQVGQRSDMSGILPVTQGEAGPYTKYSLSARIERVDAKDNSTVINLNELRVNLHVPIPTGPPASGHFEYEDIGFGTALEVPDGKTVVVGKTGARGNSQGFLVVLTGKVVH